jgi:hypothetical protein
MKVLMTSNNVNEQQESLCLSLQQNRRVIERALVNSETEFPRSFSMRLLTQNKADLGLGLFRFFVVSFSFLSFMKRKFERNNYIEHSDDKPTQKK